MLQRNKMLAAAYMFINDFVQIWAGYKYLKTRQHIGVGGARRLEALGKSKKPYAHAFAVSVE